MVHLIGRSFRPAAPKPGSSDIYVSALRVDGPIDKKGIFIMRAVC